MNQIWILVLLYGCVRSATFDLGGLFVSVVKTVHSAYQQLDLSSNSVDNNNPGVSLNDFDELPDGSLCAKELSHMLTSCITRDDGFSERTCPIHGNWRNLASPSFIPLAIGCVAEKMTNKKAKIVCRAEIDGEREVFAKYWAYFPDADSKGTASQEFTERLGRLRTFESRNVCLRKMFEVGHGSWLFSPFHPEYSHFDVQFRKYRQQKICRVVLDTLPETKRLSRSLMTSSIAIDYISTAFPKLFHRLLSDVFHVLPEECRDLPPVVPIVVTDVGNASKHVARTLELLQPYQMGFRNSRFTATHDATNACNPLTGGTAQAPLSKLRPRIQKCLEVDSLKYYRCDQGLPIWTKSALCPPTTACYDADICNRMVSCGDGLWLAVRGQSAVESGGHTAVSWVPVPETLRSSISAYAAPIDYDPTTKSFYEFAKNPDHPYNSAPPDQVIWHKLHISTRTSGMFLIVFYHPPSDKTGLDYPAKTCSEYEKEADDYRKAIIASRFESKENTSVGTAYDSFRSSSDVSYTSDEETTTRDKVVGPSYNSDKEDHKSEKRTLEEEFEFLVNTPRETRFPPVVSYTSGLQTKSSDDVGK